MEHLVDVDCERSLVDRCQLLSDSLICDMFVLDSHLLDQQAEHFKGNTYLSAGDDWQQEMYRILAKSVETLTSCKRLFAFFEGLTSHVNEF